MKIISIFLINKQRSSNIISTFHPLHITLEFKIKEKKAFDISPLKNHIRHLIENNSELYRPKKHQLLVKVFDSPLFYSAYSENWACYV